MVARSQSIAYFGHALCRLSTKLNPTRAYRRSGIFSLVVLRGHRRLDLPREPSIAGCIGQCDVTPFRVAASLFPPTLVVGTYGPTKLYSSTPLAAARLTLLEALNS